VKIANLEISQDDVICTTYEIEKTISLEIDKENNEENDELDIVICFNQIVGGNKYITKIKVCFYSEDKNVDEVCKYDELINTLEIIFCDIYGDSNMFNIINDIEKKVVNVIEEEEIHIY